VTTGATFSIAAVRSLPTAAGVTPDADGVDCIPATDGRFRFLQAADICFGACSPPSTTASFLSP